MLLEHSGGVTDLPSKNQQFWSEGQVRKEEKSILPSFEVINYIYDSVITKKD